MRFNRYTQKSQEAVMAAQESARSQDHAEVRPVHLLSALLDKEQSVIQSLLGKLKIDPSKLESAVRKELDRLPRATGSQIGASRALLDVFADAQKQADRLKDEFVSTEHLLLGLINKGELTEVFR
ncbi:MAG TPA: Clp protease N-terminal domain-containing protein, partial [Tepidisphaeraceae bacterium]|nr:Clp protease N-terminal domain-containing protein [Tepidisphaeraceae bacterium]